MRTSLITDATRVVVRSHRVALTVARSGVWGLLSAIGFELGRRGIGFVKTQGPSPRPIDSVMAQALTGLLVELGPTFIKLGQMLASRPDVVGTVLSDELKTLYDSVPPLPFRHIKTILVRELGRKKLKNRFRTIDPKPLGSASLAQVHRAILKDGEAVVLKVQKPKVAGIIRADLLILKGLANAANRIYPKYQFNALFEDFEIATLREIDYREEAKNIARFQKNHQGIFSKGSVRFPGFIDDLTTERVITLEPMQGTPVSKLKKGTTVARRAAVKSLAAVLEQIFDHGFFHADPHAGNLFFMEESGDLGFIDLGLVGSLRPEDKRKFLKCLFAILKRDRNHLAKSLFELGTPSPSTDALRFEKAVDLLLDEIKRRGLDDLQVEKTVNRLLEIARHEGLFIPNRYVLLLRSCLIIEGVAKGLDPKLSLAAIATPIVARSLLKSLSPLKLFRRS